MTKQPLGISEGIYFNLTNEAYHADPALSHSGMTKLLLSWQDFWTLSIHNPERKKYEATPAMKFGERSGMLLLEPKKFHENYNTYGKSAADKKGTWLSSSDYGNLVESIRGVTDEPDARAHFEDGYAEVSIFWRDPTSGIMLRVKVDYLRTFGAIDFKRIMAVDNYTIGKAVKAQGLDIQNFLYLEGIKAARRMLKGLSHVQLVALAEREKASLEWLQAFRDDEDLLYKFLFQRSTPPYIWKFKTLEPEVYMEGGNATMTAIRLYKEGLEKFGLGKPPMGEGAVTGTVSQYHVPRRDYDYEQ